ncbi:response regulator [Natrialbaceae archaeon A-arb3/5]
MGNRLAEPIEILLVEDNPGDVRLTQEAFNGLSSDVSLTVTTDGSEALDVLQERHNDASVSLPDLILLDLNLPRTNGFEFLETIREDPELARLPVLILTSSSTTEDIIESYDLAANAYLTKPSSPAEFETMVEAVSEFWFEQAALPPVST